MFRRFLVLAVSALLVGVSAGCGDSSSWVEPRAASAWPAQYGDAANSSFVDTDGADTLALEWSRSVKGNLGAAVAIGDDGDLAANAQTAAGCSLMVWEADNDARQRWCTRLYPGGGDASALFDGFGNLYVGQPGLIQSFPLTQWVRWRKPVIGAPTTPRFLPAGQLLVVTHLGQVLVFDAHRGAVAGTALDLVTGIDPTDSERGLADCRPARPGCPVAAAPAFSAAGNIVVVNLWEPGADAPVLVGLRYRPGQNPLLMREWTSDAVDRGPLGSPVLSADGATVYVNGRDERLWALNTSDGSAKWSVPLDYQPQTPPSVSPDGVIVAGGGPGAKLTALRDEGDSAAVVWTRDEVAPLTTSSRAGRLGYTVAAAGERGQDLLVFDTADGRTVNTYPLPEATGWPVGVSLGAGGRVLAATSDGQVYGFAPE